MIKEAMISTLIGLLFLPMAYMGGCNSQEENANDSAIKTTTVLSVDDAVKSLKPDSTARTVIGVVQTVTPDENLLTLIDVEEYKLCGLSDCCLYMPVVWQGEMPNIEDIVTVEGRIDSTESGLVFSAIDLHVKEAASSQ